MAWDTLDPFTSSATDLKPVLSTPVLQGSVLVLIQFDVCEEIHLDKLRQIFGARQEQPAFKHPTPGYVRYQRPPVVEPIEPLVLESGEILQGEIKYYDYGVLSVIFVLPFSGDWDKLIRLSTRWAADVDFERHASRIAHQKLERAAPALVKPYNEWLSEDYFIFHVKEIESSPSAPELVASQGARIAQVVRGETITLSDGERDEILQSRISYYQTDLAVIGWNSAFIYDTTAGAETAIELLEYASKLHTVLLDVIELTEHADNAIKFLSDMFSARLYKLAAAKVGVPDYKDLVTQKLHTAEDLYRFMVDQFNQSRAFVLELMVVIILIIELVYVFHGK
jgi:hypothetical protein